MAVDAAHRYNLTYSSPHAASKQPRGGFATHAAVRTRLTVWQHRKRANPPPAVRQPQTNTNNAPTDAPTCRLAETSRLNAVNSHLPTTASAPNSGDRLGPTEGHAPSAHTGWNVCPDRGSWGVTEEPAPDYHPPVSACLLYWNRPFKEYLQFIP